MNIEKYIVFNHGENPHDATGMLDTYREAQDARGPGQGIAALVFEYSDTEIVDESHDTEDEDETDPENIYGSATMRQSIEEDRR